MEQTKKRAKVWLCIAIALMLLSMVVVSTVQTAGGKVTIKDLRWETTVGVQMSGLLFVPGRFCGTSGSGHRRKPWYV